VKNYLFGLLSSKQNSAGQRCNETEHLTLTALSTAFTMAVGQTRSIREGFNSATAKIKQNFFQFALTALLVMACGATNKVTRHCEIEKETYFFPHAPARGRPAGAAHGTRLLLGLTWGEQPISRQLLGVGGPVAATLCRFRNRFLLDCEARQRFPGLARFSARKASGFVEKW
jgi:hypothetical protein